MISKLYKQRFMKREFRTTISQLDSHGFTERTIGSLIPRLYNLEFTNGGRVLMFLVAVTCGNTYVLKPSKKDPGASIILAELALEVGLPKGVLNIVHGTNEIVNAICDDDDIKAVSFVGSNTAGMHIYARATAKGNVSSPIWGPKKPCDCPA